MNRIEGPTATNDRKFTEGDPEVPIPPTIVSAKWANAVQEEIAGIVEAAGLTLSDLDDAQLLAALDAIYARLVSPSFTGTPTAPTASQGADSDQLATLTYVRAAAAAIVGGAPSTLDALNELATALGSDPNFATTMATALGLKAPLVSPSFTGTPTAPTAAGGTNTTQLATAAFVGSELDAVQGSQDFLSSNTWVVPAHVKRVHLLLVAGGGAGGGATGASPGGGGGGGGEIIERTVPVAPGETITVTVGAGGTGNGGDGSDGGSSQVAIPSHGTLVAMGGRHGQNDGVGGDGSLATPIRAGAQPSDYPVAGGSGNGGGGGGGKSGGDDGDGADTVYGTGGSGGAQAEGGGGGGASYGNGGTGATDGQAGGTASANSGAGGGGASGTDTGGAGGNGGSGRVRIIW